MTSFPSDTVAYVIGIIVGILAAAAVLVIVGLVLYRKLGLAEMEEDNDEELKALKSRVSVYADRSNREQREENAHVLAQEVPAPGNRPRFATAADAKLVHRQQ